MTREELFEKVRILREEPSLGEPTKEELQAYDANAGEFYIPGREGHQIHVYRYAPDHLPAQAPLIINFHGGGFIFGWSEKSGLFCSKLALAHECIVWDVDYSVAPEAPFPAAVHESYDVCAYAFDHAGELGIDPKRVILGGHSAGANLAATVCMKLSETHAFCPAGLIMDYPPLDVDTEPFAKEQAEEAMAAERAVIFNASYCPNKEGKDPYASPIYAETSMLTAFPETLIITCQLDNLCKEGEQFAGMLVEAGITVTSRRFLKSSHGFTIGRREEWEDAMELIHGFIKRVI
ncbi:MAG: alpha/beta hydrolase [Hungatella sp.]|nr:alpha/beta hydrolase [Hungatella sp.]